MLPQADLEVTLLTTLDAARQVTLTAHTPTGLALLHAAEPNGAPA